jgi:hypothetical protein
MRNSSTTNSRSLVGLVNAVDLFCCLPRDPQIFWVEFERSNTATEHSINSHDSHFSLGSKVWVGSVVGSLKSEARTHLMRNSQIQRKNSQLLSSSSKSQPNSTNDERLHLLTELRHELNRFHLIQEHSLELTTGVVQRVNDYQPSLKRCLDSYERTIEENRRLREENLECQGY